MREIKFRAWSNGQMEYSKESADFTFWKWVAYDSTTELMQYTGIKDKNGKEIYEGDIVRNNASDDLVEWKGAAWGYSNVMWPDKIEVIGNIYENPELIKTK